MSAEKLIQQAASVKPPFTPAQLKELQKLVAHNDSVPKGKRVSGEKAAAFFGMPYETFLRKVRLALGRSWGGQ